MEGLIISCVNGLDIPRTEADRAISEGSEIKWEQVKRDFVECLFGKVLLTGRSSRREIERKKVRIRR